MLTSYLQGLIGKNEEKVTKMVKPTKIGGKVKFKSSNGLQPPFPSAVSNMSLGRVLENNENESELEKSLGKTFSKSELRHVTAAISDVL